MIANCVPGREPIRSERRPRAGRRAPWERRTGAICRCGARAEALALALGLLLVIGSGCAREDDSLRLVGTVERSWIELVAPVSETILAIEAERGDHVEAGQVVVRLDPVLAEVEVARAEANAAGARTGLVVAWHDLDRLRKLARARTASAQDLDRARLVHDEAQARLREAEALLQAARKHRRDLELTAPEAGVVDQLPFDLGERVPAGAVVAVVLGDADPWVRVWIPERYFALVGPDTPASIEIDGVPGPLEGRVVDVAREPEFTPHYALTERERVHLVYEARVRVLDAPAALRPGVPAEVTLEPAPEP